MRPSNALITPEGYPFIAYSAGLFLFLAGGAVLLKSVALAVPAAVTLLLVLFVISFFRNPERMPPADTALLVAPADGTVVYVGPATQEHLGACQKISIFMSVFNVHVNRAPISGTVVDRFYKQGKFYDARHADASCENEQCGLVMEQDNGVRVAFVQIAGLIARRILCYAEVGDRLERGQRYGMIRFGSRVDVYLPEGLESLVTVGQTTVAGETALVRLG
ncbi:phosphatidylserine decarboxylase family protein [Trichlorobacter lovleyi]|uniref:Phosphatidylserine decarboxylase proenzyme n=1 Tax=Trichlorobacter lovleyi (strain ATCC BAA-1151 / DSM 17278 / SZ) TaxID=398767 RepID=PSD_TRIL1|nr:phosphatidylserine decarboxylase family protein [Trichlorobacter lovleyi]B3E5X3.1 RecName: Full=Phosphatidylserine decarboxylase proenzyme; Contains: RecName: Full=Phosphatidylserine decarboxylase alpha chain; Contains: RecName: Full=Phosphatidylserine decarboxylase beta chain [Trichlorobacter lovleyi SZ]ACD96214.1 phosphatidylserine decarboxylase related protein [Trichlorobacter lovleyi SZ]